MGWERKNGFPNVGNFMLGTSPFPILRLLSQKPGERLVNRGHNLDREVGHRLEMNNLWAIFHVGG